MVGLSAEMFSPSCCMFSSVTSLCSIVLVSYEYPCTILGNSSRSFRYILSFANSEANHLSGSSEGPQVCVIVVDARLVSHHRAVLPLRR